MAHRCSTVLETAWDNTVKQKQEFDSFCMGIQHKLPKTMNRTSGTRPWRSYYTIQDSLNDSYEELTKILRLRGESHRIFSFDPMIQYCGTDDDEPPNSVMNILKTEMVKCLDDKFWSSLTQWHWMATYLELTLKQLPFGNDKKYIDKQKAEIKKNLHILANDFPDNNPSTMTIFTTTCQASPAKKLIHLQHFICEQDSISNDVFPLTMDLSDRYCSSLTQNESSLIKSVGLIAISCYHMAKKLRYNPINFKENHKISLILNDYTDDDIFAGYRSYVTKRKPFRKARHSHVRLKFAREQQYWSDNDWKYVVFSDESHFEVLNRKNRSFVRYLRSEQDKPFNFRARVQGGGGCVSVWGCMTAEGIGSLVVYKGRVNGKKYIEMLNLSLPSFIKKRFKPGQKWYFMQDNAPVPHVQI
ncbi:unnamed protein product [Didymodactylos carnosus]|uniref:Uncharacterized protein n=1 Tax=Didymodactylos carnosus TaxID=1234261 RepID=A0A814S2M0_9BILA|nr:unnamed protein product [Didymodactylos carnosus]CAF3904372.1 unnamed protein product [Didymodactylos carnosus]